MIGIDPGALRHLIVIDAPIDVQDSNGDPVRSWEELAQVHASVEHLRANEILALQTIVGAMDTRFKVRYDAVTAQITARHRIRFDGVVYNITGPTDIQHRGILLEIIARSGVNDG
jgi:SPP1 family predicted phage head-tail adaptor